MRMGGNKYVDDTTITAASPHVQEATVGLNQPTHFSLVLRVSLSYWQGQGRRREKAPKACFDYVVPVVVIILQDS
jgi:hypothetical protein